MWKWCVLHYMMSYTLSWRGKDIWWHLGHSYLPSWNWFMNVIQRILIEHINHCKTTVLWRLLNLVSSCDCMAAFKLGFWAETINMPSFVEDDEQNDKRKAPKREWKVCFAILKTTLTLEKALWLWKNKHRVTIAAPTPLSHRFFSVLSKTEKSKISEQIK